MRKAFKNQYLEIEMGNAFASVGGLKCKEGIKSKTRGVESLTVESI